MSGTLILTPWAAQALSLAEERDIARRAVELHARVRVGGKSPGGPWSIRVHSWAGNVDGPVHRFEVFTRTGHLADLIFAALDEYERHYVFTADELVQLQGQTHAG